MGHVSYSIGPNQLKYLLTRPINFARTQSNSPLLVTSEVVAAVTVSHCSRYILDLIADYAATRRTVRGIHSTGVPWNSSLIDGANFINLLIIIYYYVATALVPWVYVKKYYFSLQKQTNNSKSKSIHNYLF